jgi:hypothetical protein
MTKRTKQCIEEMEDSIRRDMQRLRELKRLEKVDLSREPVLDEGQQPINDLQERELILQYFYERMTLQQYERYMPNIFVSRHTVIFIANSCGIPSPYVSYQ